MRTTISLAQGGFVYQSFTSAEFHFEHTLDFIAHGFCAGIAEMDMNLVGCLTDFLYQRGAILGALAGMVSAVCMVRFLRSWRSFLRTGLCRPVKISLAYCLQCLLLSVG